MFHVGLLLEPKSSLETISYNNRNKPTLKSFFLSKNMKLIRQTASRNSLSSFASLTLLLQISWTKSMFLLLIFLPFKEIVLYCVICNSWFVSTDVRIPQDKVRQTKFIVGNKRSFGCFEVSDQVVQGFSLL